MNTKEIGAALALLKGKAIEQVPGAVDDWLDNNPDATTTVQDGAITKEKLHSDLKEEIETNTSDVSTLKSALQESVSEETGQELLDEEEKNTYLLTVALDNVDKLIASLPQDETLVSLIGELQTECEWLDMIYHELQVKQEASA